MKAYLLDKRGESIYLVFGEDCVSAAKVLAEKLGCDYEDFSVGGSFDVDPNEPINVGKWWPYFTCNPPERYLGN